MYDRISEDIKTAMKARLKTRLEALRYVKKLLIENKTAKNPKNEMDVVIAYAKQLKDALTTMPVDSDIYSKTQEELVVLAEYLPQQLSEHDVKALIESIQSQQESATFAEIMKALSPQIKGRFDGKQATELVKSLLPQ